MDKEIEIPENELEDNIDEFIRFMHDSFMVGNDQNYINYEIIDNDEYINYCFS